MPAPYSKDLREKVIFALKKGNKNQTQIANKFDVSTSFVSSLYKHYKKNGSVEPQKIGGYRKPKITLEGREHITVWIENEPSLTLQELCERYNEHFKITVSRNTMSLTLKKMKITFKKKAHMIRKKKVLEFKN